MNTEQLKQAALNAPKGKWEHFVLDKPLRDVPAYVEKCIDASPGKDFYFVMGQHPQGGEADICHVGNGPSAAALSAYIAAANPAVILALLECVDALRLYKNWLVAEKGHGGTSFWDRVEMCREAESATDAALQKLEAL